MKVKVLLAELLPLVTVTRTVNDVCAEGLFNVNVVLAAVVLEKLYSEEFGDSTDH